LIGGRVDRGEALESALRREVREELYIGLDELIEVGDYRYKGSFHRVFGVETDERIIAFDRSELTRIGWHSLEEVEAMEERDQLHTGFEFQAVHAYHKRRRQG
jgi:NADH pyrophosphatase NudC (nudix superfamily)